MDRDASAGFLAELAKSRNSPFRLIEVHMDSGTAYMTNAHRPIVWNGNTYLALGHLLDVGEITESADVRVSQINISLSGLDPRLEAPSGGSLVAAFLGEDYIDRRVVVYTAFVTESFGVHVLDAPIFDGRMDQPVIVENPDGGGVCTIAVSAASHWVDFERRPGRHTNDAEQQFHFPGDLGFQFVSESNKPIKWGD